MISISEQIVGKPGSHVAQKLCLYCRSLQWDEANLQLNEEEKVPRMKIDEPPTPYYKSVDEDFGACKLLKLGVPFVSSLFLIQIGGISVYLGRRCSHVTCCGDLIFHCDVGVL